MDQLQLAEALFAGLDSEGTTYSHWKSNEHLVAGLEGKTDLDLLVLPDDRTGFEKVLAALGFVPMKAASVREIPDVVSHLGLDSATGSLLHLDTQYRLVVGEQLVKNHTLPLDEWVFQDGRVMHGVKVPSPERELTLLYIRAMLKSNARQFARSLLRGGTPIPERILREARWLADQVEPEGLQAAARASGIGLTDNEVTQFVERVNEGDLPWQYVRERRDSLRRRLRTHERHTRSQLAAKRATLRFRSSFLGRRLGAGIPSRSLGRAPMVAVIGADGSGKSTLARDLRAWLGWKLDVRHFYFGQPKGGLVWKLLNKPGSMARRSGREPSGFAAWTEKRKWLWLARHRRRLAAEGRRLADRGVLVVAERYPLPDFESMDAPMDGPRLRDTAQAERERAEYRALPVPDLTLILRTDLDTLRDRKVDLTVDEHRGKVDAVAQLEPAPGRVILDAGPPYQRMLLEAKVEIWKAILGSH